MSVDKPKQKKQILSSADDVRMAAGLLAMEEVDRLLDRVEELKLIPAIELGVNAAFKQAMPVQVKAIEGVVVRQLVAFQSSADDPLSLKKPQPIVKDPANNDRIISYLITGLLGVLIGSLSMYFLMSN